MGNKQTVINTEVEINPDYDPEKLVIRGRSNESDKIYPIEIYGEKGELIGEGRYGKVYSTTKGYALKITTNDKQYYKSEGIETAFLKESAIYLITRHINVVDAKYINLIGDGITSIIIQPLAIKSLHRLGLIKSIDELKPILYQVMRGLAYMHSNFILHLDIKPGNVLLFADGSVKISDFGLSMFCPYVKIYKNLHVQTIIFRAPEIILGDRYYGFTVDVWSVGMMIIDMMLREFRTKAYNIENNFEMLDIIEDLIGSPNANNWPAGMELMNKWDEKFKNKKSTLQTLFPNFNSIELDFLNKTLAYPDKRMTSSQSLKHPFFDSVRKNIDERYPGDIEYKSCYNILNELDIRNTPSRSLNIMFDFLLGVNKYLLCEEELILRTFIDIIKFVKYVQYDYDYKVAAIAILYLNAKLRESGSYGDFRYYLIKANVAVSDEDFLKLSDYIFRDILRYNLVKSTSIDYIRTLKNFDTINYDIILRIYDTCVYCMCIDNIRDNRTQKEIAEIIMYKYKISDPSGCLIPKNIPITFREYSMGMYNIGAYADKISKY